MAEPATLRLDAGDEVRVAVEREDLDHEEITVRRLDAPAAANGDLLRVIDEHLATATPHPAGTTDQLLQADRDRPY